MNLALVADHKPRSFFKVIKLAMDPGVFGSALTPGYPLGTSFEEAQNDVYTFLAG